jgi:phosphatidylserine/phosphatidylglycerophosphate/cardiolipin synthase-like enzyme
VQLIIQPDDGLNPVLKAIGQARRAIDIVIFRFNRPEVEKALAAAVQRGVLVRALIAYTNSGGRKALRKLELRLLEAGVTVSRTADDLPRYHGKMTIVDDRLFVLGFNYTKQDVEKSRSFGISTKNSELVKEALSLFDADATRQPYQPKSKRLVVSPQASRDILTDLIKRTKKRLLIYDERVSDPLILRVLKERAAAGVEIRIIGKLGKEIPGIITRRISDLKLHVRAIMRDGTRAFVGSQSLRKLELDARREVGVIVTEARIVRKMQDVFEADWQHSPATSKEEKQEEKEKEKEREKQKEQADKTGSGEKATA